VSKKSYTEAQERSFRAQFAQKKRRRNTLMILAVAIGLVLVPTIEAVINSRGSLTSIVLLLGLIALGIAGTVFEYRDWHCPACGESLGNERNPKHCRKCGISLQ